MTFEPALLTALTASALIALIAAVIRLIALFSAPYIDPAKTAHRWRGPRLRIWLMLIPVVALCVGVLAIYGLTLLKPHDTLHWTVKLAAILGLMVVVCFCFLIVAFSLLAQSTLVLNHALETRYRGGTAGSIRSTNLLEIGVLFAVGAGYILISGFGMLDLRDVSLLSLDELVRRLRLFDLLAYATIFVGIANIFLRVAARVSGTGGIVLTWIGIAITNAVLRFIYERAVPSRFDVERYAQRRDPLDAAQDFVTGIIQAEILALIGLALVVTLVAGPFLDRVLQQADRDGRLTRYARLLFFLVALGVGAGFAFSTQSADLLTASFLFPALVLAACGAAGSGLLRREPKIAEPIPVEVF